MTEPTVNVGELIEVTNKLVVSNARMFTLINKIEARLTTPDPDPELREARAIVDIMLAIKNWRAMS